MPTVQINNHPVEIHVSSFGSASIKAGDLLRAVGYKRPSDAIIHYEEQSGEKLPIFQNLDNGGRAKWFPHARAIEFLSTCRYHRRMVAVIEALNKAVEESLGTTTQTATERPRVRRPKSKLAQNDKAAGVAWLTEILADTTLPYALHEQALRTRAGLLTILKTIKEIA